MIPVARVLFGRGKPFPCRGCKHTLMIEKAGTKLAIAGFVVASLVGKQFGTVAVVIMLFALLLFEWLVVKVRAFAMLEVAD